MTAVDRAALAAGNNADWCDLVCRSQRVPTTRERGVWAARRRSPQRYPDAVTLRRGLSPEGVLALVDDTPGCSVKDSFHDLDLAALGFEVLFSASWIHCEPVATRPAGKGGWELAGTAEELAEWSAAAGAGDTFRPELLTYPAVRFLVARDAGGISAGAIVNRSTSAIGIGNVFCTTMTADAAWAGIVAMLATSFPGLALVGYERGSDVSPARRAGFNVAGPLRVWARIPAG